MEKHKNERLLVLGGGETASDICMEWLDHVKFTYWSIPRGQHFIRKYGKLVPWAKLTAFDKASSRMRVMLSPFIMGKLHGRRTRGVRGGYGPPTFHDRTHPLLDYAIE